MEKDFVLSLMSNKRSARSLQKAVGPSEIGGCRRQVWHRVNSTPVTNVDTLEMAAWMGTAIHTALENRIERADPFHERYLTELEVSADGIKGHIDGNDTDFFRTAWNNLTGIATNPNEIVPLHTGRAMRRACHMLCIPNYMSSTSSYSVVIWVVILGQSSTSSVAALPRTSADAGARKTGTS